ncbi:MAG: hypothetical protein ACOYIR_06765, partial [Christensenellales bacterium]
MKENMLRPPILLYCFGVGDKLSAKIGTILHGRQKQPRFDKGSMFFAQNIGRNAFLALFPLGKPGKKRRAGDRNAKQKAHPKPGCV